RYLMLTGFGCSSKGTERIDGNLRVGYAAISGLAPNRIALGSPFVQSDAILCAGDSGGPAYRVFGDPRPSVIVGVNSANILQRNISFLAPTSSPGFVSFFGNWRARWNNPKVCGVDSEIESKCYVGNRARAREGRGT